MRKISVRFLLPTVMVVGATALAGCGSNDDAGLSSTTVPATTATTASTVPATTATTAPSTTSTTAPITTTTAPSTTTSTVVTVGKNREIFGWIRSFEGSADGTITLQIDEAEMLTGDEAIAAARQDGDIGPGEELPNDFYIRNPDDSTIKLSVSPKAVVILQACYENGECVTTEEVDLETWSVLLGGEDDPGLDWNWYGAGLLPYDFTVENGVITKVQETYLP